MLDTAIRSAYGHLICQPDDKFADAERARVNVTRTLRAATDRITTASPSRGAT